MTRLKWGLWIQATFLEWRKAGGCGLSHLTESQLCKLLRKAPIELDTMTILDMVSGQPLDEASACDPRNMAARELSRFVREHRDQINWDSECECECDADVVPGVIWPTDGIFIEKCDLCNRYLSDYDACRAVSRLVGIRPELHANRKGRRRWSLYCIYEDAEMLELYNKLKEGQRHE